MKICFPPWIVAIAILTLWSMPQFAQGAGGTSQVASKGHRVDEQQDWPKGVEALLNLPSRTDGWNGWFSEWPNDVSHYQFEIKNTDEANAVLAAFAKIKADKLYVRLSPGKEPGSIGWVSRIKAGNNTAILFTQGDQARLDAWFMQLKDGKFGVMEFAAAPLAVPPTLTIFVENDAIDLEKLSIPAQVDVEAGGLPGLFHRDNLKVDPTKRAAALELAKPDDKLQKVLERIQDFMARRRRLN